MRIAVGIVIGLLVLVVGFMRVLGPFAGHFPSHGVSGFRRDLSAWRQGWRTRPRPAVSWHDWFPHTGAVFVPACVAVLSVATSIGLLTSSPRRTVLGIVCAAAACGLAGLLVQFFRRPVRDPFDATATAAVIDGGRPLLVGDLQDSVVRLLPAGSRRSADPLGLAQALPDQGRSCARIVTDAAEAAPTASRRQVQTD